MKKVFFMFWGFVQPVTVFSKVKRESVHRLVTDVPAPYTASEAERGSAPQTFTEELALCLWDSFLRDAGLAARSAAPDAFSVNASPPTGPARNSRSVT